MNYELESLMVKLREAVAKESPLYVGDEGAYGWDSAMGVIENILDKATTSEG